MKKGWRKLLSLAGIGLLIFVIGYYYYVPGIPPEVLNEKYGVTAAQYVQVDDMKVHYKIAGPASDTLPLVLLHGTFSSLYTWNAWTDLLKEDKRIIRLDLPGFGLTGPHPKGDYRVGIYLKFLESFLSKLEVKQCILVGNSLGGEIAWRYALNNPDKVKKLILIGAAGYPVDLGKLPLSEIPVSYLWLRVPLVRELTVKFSNRRSIRKNLAYLYGRPERITDEMVEIYYDMTNREGNREALTERMESFTRPSPLEKISSIKIPTLILWGADDRLIPVENARRFHQDLPCSKLTIFPSSGHMPMEEIPLKSAEVAAEFIGSNPGC